MYNRLVKPTLDFLIASVAILLLSPVMLLITLSLAIFQRNNPFFVQERVGRNSIVFKLFKFKTMKDKFGSDNLLLPDKDRLTSIGKWVRSTSLDELPQLFNVLKGDMSLVGPRPLLVKYLPLYSKRQARRHEVRPGITGWAQVNGRNAISWHERFELDLYYVENQHFLLDLNILWKTAVKVLKREGVNSQTSVTMESFKGN